MFSIKQKQYDALKNIYDYLDKLIIENPNLNNQKKNIKMDKQQISKLLLEIENELKNI